MEEQKDKERKGNKEYKKLKKMFKKAYKATVKENQLDAFIENAKKNFPGYTAANKAYQEAPNGADAIQHAALNRVEADFTEAYAEQINEHHKLSRKASVLRISFENRLFKAGEEKSEEE